MRGHGESGPLATPDDGAWDRLALDEVGLIETLGLADVVLGGAPMGTATALHAALNLGDRVRAMVLTIPPTAWDTRRDQAQLYEAMADMVDTGGVETLIEASAAVPPPDPFVEVDNFRELRAESLRRADPQRLAAVFRGASHADLPDADAVATIAANADPGLVGRSRPSGVHGRGLGRPPAQRHHAGGVDARRTPCLDRCS